MKKVLEIVGKLPPEDKKVMITFLEGYLDKCNDSVRLDHLILQGIEGCQDGVCRLEFSWPIGHDPKAIIDLRR